MPRLLVFSFLVAACLVLSGCTKDAEVNKFVSDLDGVTHDVVKQVDDNPTLAGVDAAQKTFDAKKTELRAEFEALKTAKASSQTADKMVESIKQDVASVVGLQTKYSRQSSDDNFQEKLQKLGNDYVNLFKTQ